MYRKILIAGLVVLSATGILHQPYATAEEKKMSKPATAEVKMEIKKPDAGEETIRSLFEEISFLNLLNGLNLSDAQMKDIIKYNQEALQIKSEMNQQNEDLKKEIIEAYQELKKAVEKNQGISKEVEKRAFEMEMRGKKELKEQAMPALKEIENKITAVFSDAQKEVINTFNPCLIPPQNLKNPVRAGQATDNTMFTNMLKRLRSIPESEWEENKDNFVQKHLDGIQSHLGKLTPEEIAQEKKRILEVIENARTMDDAEFELNLPQLAESFKPKHKAKELHEELQKLEEQRYGTLGRIGRFFLQPCVVPVLTKRLEMMKTQK